MDVPAAFKQGPVFVKLNPHAAEVPDAWWTLFNDPVLNDLQDRLIKGNQTLASAAAAVSVAQAALGSSRASLLPAVGVSAGASRAANAASSGPATTYSLQGSLANWELDLWGRVAASVNAADAETCRPVAIPAATRLSVQATLAQKLFLLAHVGRSGGRADADGGGLHPVAGILRKTATRAAWHRLPMWHKPRPSLNQPRRNWWRHACNARNLSTLSPAGAGQAPAALALPPPSTGELPRRRLPRCSCRPLCWPVALTLLPPRRKWQRPTRKSARQTLPFCLRLRCRPTAVFERGWGSLIQAGNRFWSLGPTLAFAVFDGGARRAASDSAQASYDQTVATYRQTVLTALQEVEDNLVAASLLQEEMGLQQESLTSARRALDIAQNQYEAGTVSYLNVVTAQTTVLSAERSLLDVRNRRRPAANQLLKNLAGGWGGTPST